MVPIVQVVCQWSERCRSGCACYNCSTNLHTASPSYLCHRQIRRLDPIDPAGCSVGFSGIPDLSQKVSGTSQSTSSASPSYLCHRQIRRLGQSTPRSSTDVLGVAHVNSRAPRLGRQCFNTQPEFRVRLIVPLSFLQETRSCLQWINLVGL